jgi:hypothetical protein
MTPRTSAATFPSPGSALPAKPADGEERHETRWLFLFASLLMKGQVLSLSDAVALAVRDNRNVQIGVLKNCTRRASVRAGGLRRRDRAAASKPQGDLVVFYSIAVLDLKIVKWETAV